MYSISWDPDSILLFSRQVNIIIKNNKLIRLNSQIWWKILINNIEDAPPLKKIVMHWVISSGVGKDIRQSFSFTVCYD